MKTLASALLGFSLIATVAFGERTNSATTLTLEEAQSYALKNHPQVAAADYQVLAAREFVKQTRAGFLPSANMYMTAAGADSEDTRIMAGGLNNPSVFNRLAGGVAVNQLITDFGRTANLTASSQSRAKAESQNANATREQILLQVDVDYFNTLKAQAVLGVAQQTFDTRQLLLDRVSVLASNKLKSDLDVSFARVALEEGRLLLQKAQSDTVAARTALCTALGYQGPQAFQLVEPPRSLSTVTNNVEALVRDALTKRPELLSLRDQHDASLRLAKARRDARLPAINAIGVAGGSPTHDSRLPDTYAAGGVQLSVPLFEGGRLAAQQREAELNAESGAEHLRAVENEVVRDVHLAWLAFNNSIQESQIMQQLVKNAADAYDLAEARYQSGASSVIELSQAQLALTSAQIVETRSRYDVLIEQANLNYQTGELH